MKKESFYNVVSNRTNIASFVGSQTTRLFLKSHSQSPNVLKVSDHSPELALYLFEEGANKGIKDHLLLIYVSNGSPDYNYTLRHLNNNDLFSENIFKAITEPTLLSRPVHPRNLEGYLNGIVEISELSQSMAKKYTSYVERQYSEKVLKGALY